MGELLVHDAVLKQLIQLPGRPWEVGGWLLGYRPEGGVYVVTHATPPSAGSKFGITISGKGHQHRFDEAWERSRGAVTYLGDWHSHPGSPPTPSTTDRSALQQLAEDKNYGTPTPLMAIVSLPRLPMSRQRPALAFYERDGDGDVHPLEAIAFGNLPEAAASVPVWAWPQRGRERSRG